MILQKLPQIVKKMGFQFSLKGKTLSYAEVFAYDGIFPGLMKRAEELSSLCLGYNLGAHYEEAENTLLGKKVSLDDSTPDVIRIMCIVDQIYEIAKMNGNMEVIPVDELLYDD
jgi:intracellular multiplication protein IcmS